MLAHIAGAPVEETALSLGPVGLAAAGLAGARLRRLTAWRPHLSLRFGVAHGPRRSGRAGGRAVERRP